MAKHKGPSSIAPLKMIREGQRNGDVVAEQGSVVSVVNEVADIRPWQMLRKAEQRSRDGAAPKRFLTKNDDMMDEGETRDPMRMEAGIGGKSEILSQAVPPLVPVTRSEREAGEKEKPRLPGEQLLTASMVLAGKGDDIPHDTTVVSQGEETAIEVPAEGGSVTAKEDPVELPTVTLIQGVASVTEINAVLAIQNDVLERQNEDSSYGGASSMNNLIVNATEMESPITKLDQLAIGEGFAGNCKEGPRTFETDPLKLAMEKDGCQVDEDECNMNACLKTGCSTGKPERAVAEGDRNKASTDEASGEVSNVASEKEEAPSVSLMAYVSPSVNESHEEPSMADLDLSGSAALGKGEAITLEGDNEALAKLKEENDFLRTQLAAIKGKQPLGTLSYATVVKGIENRVRTEGEGRQSSKLLNYHEPKVVEGKRRAVIPKAIIQQGRTKWVSTLVGFFVNGRPPIPVVMKEAWRRWKAMGLQKVVANDNDYFFFTFKEESAMRGIFEEEVAVFLGHTMIVQPWEEGNSYKKKNRVEIPKWCKLSNIPFEMWTEEGLSHIASLLGRPICLDTQTARLERMSYARVCIMIQQNKEIAEEVEVEVEGDQRIYVVKVETQRWYRPMPQSLPKSKNKEPSQSDPSYEKQPVGIGATRNKKRKKVWRPKATQTNMLMQRDKEIQEGEYEGGDPRRSKKEIQEGMEGEAEVAPIDPQLDAILIPKMREENMWHTIPMPRGGPRQIDLSNKQNVAIVYGDSNVGTKEPLSTPLNAPND